ncbi:hypothetical protein B8X00_13610, partial [Acetobacter fabarum]
NSKWKFIPFPGQFSVKINSLSLISPFFAAGGWSWHKLPAVMVAAILERAAFEFLSYIPAKETSKEDKQ